MKTGCTEETVRGIVVTNAGVAGTGTSVDITAAFYPTGAAKNFDEITVFNDTDRPIKVEWTNDKTGGVDFFMVPNGGKSFTHRLNKGFITNASLKVYSWNNVLATGSITINLVKNL